MSDDTRKLQKVFGVAVTDAEAEEDIKRQLFPDQEAFGQEEQRRFEILLAHWDVPVQDVELGP
jgi:hypothetical protein